MISASGSCSWNDYESLRIIFLDGHSEITSINIPLSQCISTWILEFNIMVSSISEGVAEINTFGNFKYVRAGGTIFEGSNISSLYRTNQDIVFDIQAVLSNGQTTCDKFLILKKL